MTVEEVLNRYGQDLVQAMKDALHAKDAYASGQLESMMDYDVEATADGYTLYLVAPDYLKWLDQGTRPHWAPIEPLQRWVWAKGIVPEERNGKLPTVEQLPYMIQHGIAEHGTEGIHQVNAVANMVLDRWIDQLEDAMLEDLGYELKGILKNK